MWVDGKMEEALRLKLTHSDIAARQLSLRSLPDHAETDQGRADGARSLVPRTTRVL